MGSSNNGNIDDIIIKVWAADEGYDLIATVNSYRSLMFFLNDNIYLDGFGECKGMGRCGTCQIEILSKNILTDCFDRNEEATLKKLGITDPNVRLSCQMLITQQLNSLEVKIINC